MAGNAVIGALRVNLGIDSAQFEAGLKKAQGGLASFGRLAGVGLAAAATAAVAAGAALGVLGKNAINTADDLSKAAQKAGVTTEALSRLKYAADFSDVSLEQLTGGLQKLSRNLADVASGKGGSAATALQALGISATDSEGRLRQADDVMAQVAERFARMENGSTKTALAIQLFGKSGAELIPLLNSGRDGLKQMADESDRLGLTVSTKTGRAAEKFNDTLTLLRKIFDGLIMRVATGALPQLQKLADLLTSPAFQQAAEAFGKEVVEQFGKVIEMIGQTRNEWEGFVDWMNRGGRPKVLPLGSQNIEDRSTPGALDFQRRAGAMVGASFDALDGSQMFGSTGDMWKALRPPSLPTFNDTGASEALASRLEALREALRTEEESERESYARRREEIQKFYDDGVIQRDEYDKLLLRAQEDHSEKMIEIAKEQAEKEAQIREQLVDNVASIFGSLGTLAENMGEKNLGIAKAFGVAEAIINTAQGITKALAQGGILGFAGAAAVAAAGAAQISTILSTQKGSGSKPSVRGGASAEPAVAAPVAAAEPGKAVNITFQGLGRAGMEQFVRELNDALGDGVKLNMNPA